MSILNSILVALFDALLLPFRGFSPIVGLTVVSVVVGTGMLIVFKKTSDQDALAAVKRQIHAGIFEIRLFNDDFRAILRAQVEILRHNANYLRLTLVPVLWMIVPLVLMIIQLQFHYGYGGLEPDSPVLLKVKLQEGGSAATPDIALGAPDGVRIDSQLLWIPSEREANWRVVAERPGDYELTVRVGNDAFTKSLRSSDRVVRRSPYRPSSFLEQIAFPAEAPLPPDAPVESITLGYPEIDVNLLGIEMNWIIAFFILTIVVAFALRKLFGVTL